MKARAVVLVACVAAPGALLAQNPPVPEPPPHVVWRRGTTPLDHRQVEHLARDVAYTGGREYGWTMSFPENLRRNGLEMLGYIDDTETTGLQATLVRDVHNPANVYLLFRGTEFHRDEDRVNDVAADLGAIGRDQYEARWVELQDWAARYKGQLTVVGHSLGGAIGQRFVADHPENVKDAVLFNAPGVERALAERVRTEGVRLPPITYYVSPSDPVSSYGGDEHLRGEVVQVSGGAVDPSNNALSGGPQVIGVHQGYMLQGGTETRAVPFDVWQRQIDSAPARSPEEVHKLLELQGQYRDRLARGELTLREGVTLEDLLNAIKDLGPGVTPEQLDKWIGGSATAPGAAAPNAPPAGPGAGPAGPGARPAGPPATPVPPAAGAVPAAPTAVGHIGVNAQDATTGRDLVARVTLTSDGTPRRIFNVASGALEAVPVGEYAIHVEAAGYLPSDYTVTVESRVTTWQIASLTSNLSSVTIIVVDARTGAALAPVMITLTGTGLYSAGSGMAPTTVRLAAGTYTVAVPQVTIRGQSYLAKTETYAVAEGGPAELRIALERAPEAAPPAAPQGGLSIRIEHASLDLEIGEGLEVRASVLDADGREVPDAPVSWATGSAAVATVDANGYVHAVARGRTQLIARSGTVSAAIPLSVRSDDVLSTCEITNPVGRLTVGGAHDFRVRALDTGKQELAGVRFFWAGSNDAVGTIGAGNGHLLARTPGTVTIYATGYAEGVDRVLCSADVTVEAEQTAPPPPASPRPPPPPDKQIGNVVVNTRQITVTVWDEECEDGDRITVRIGGIAVFNDHTLTKAPQSRPSR